jgi:AraC-like DNA-binding protein
MERSINIPYILTENIDTILNKLQFKYSIEKYSYDFVNPFYQIIYNNYPILYVFITDSCQSYNEVNDTHVATIDTIFSIYYALTFLNVKFFNIHKILSYCYLLHNVKTNNKKDELLAFKHTDNFTKTFALSIKKRHTLDALLNHSYSGSLENIFVNAKIHELLVYSLESIIDEKEVVFTCKFLADERGKQSIYQAREFLLQHIGDPITIKELSRKVAMNECYLKKGFKEVYGTTIFDFYQQQRMEHAKYLLYEKSLSVTDVSALLGYSSISHFSAAFKKHTGLKPCELLN